MVLNLVSEFSDSELNTSSSFDNNDNNNNDHDLLFEQSNNNFEKNKKNNSKVKSLKESKEEVFGIISERQKKLREQAVSVPYHKPKPRTFKEFFEKRPRFSDLIPKDAQNLPVDVAITVANKYCAEKISEKIIEHEKHIEEFFKSDDSCSETDESNQDDQIDETSKTQLDNKIGFMGFVNNENFESKFVSYKDDVEKMLNGFLNNFTLLPPPTLRQRESIDHFLQNGKKFKKGGRSKDNYCIDLTSLFKKYYFTCEQTESPDDKTRQNETSVVKQMDDTNNESTRLAEQIKTTFENDKKMPDEKEVVRKKKLIPNDLLNITPKLSVEQCFEINLNDNLLSNEITQLKKRFIAHVQTNQKSEKKAEAEVDHSKKEDDANQMNFDNRVKLKGNLLKKIVQERSERWQNRQLEIKQNTTITNTQTNKDGYEDDALLDDDDDDYREESDKDEIEEESDLDDDDFELKEEKKKAKCEFLDNEADVDDDDENPFEDDDDQSEDENDSDGENKTSEKKKFDRILEMLDDSDDDDDLKIGAIISPPVLDADEVLNQTFSDGENDELVSEQGQTKKANNSNVELEDDLNILSQINLTGLEPMQHSTNDDQKRSNECDMETTPNKAINDSTKKLYEEHDVTSTQDNINELLELCSGKFVDRSQLIEQHKPSLVPTTLQHHLDLEQISQIDSKTQPNDQYDNKLRDEKIVDKFQMTSDDDDDVDDDYKIRKKKKRFRLDISDDEDQNIRNDILDDDDEFMLDDGDGDNKNVSDCESLLESDDDEKQIEYDSEENEIVVDKKTLRKRAKGFLENEAELSEEEEWNGSDDEDERGLDQLEWEEGDADEINEKKMQRQLGQIHMRQVLDQDKREVRLLQEILLEDGELHSDKSRQRQFKWKNNKFENNNLSNLDDEENGGEMDDATTIDETEEDWRKMRYQREMYLKQNNIEQIVDDGINNDGSTTTTTVLENSRRSLKIVEIHKTTTQQQITNHHQITTTSPFSFINNQKTSLLARGEKKLARYAELVKNRQNDDQVNVKSSLTSSKKFTFTSIDNVMISNEDENVNIINTKRKRNMLSGGNNNDNGTAEQQTNNKRFKNVAPKNSRISKLFKL